MQEHSIRFEGINLVARDVRATVAFYRLLGVDPPEETFWSTASGVHHVEGVVVGDKPPEFEFDSTALAVAYNSSFQASPNDMLLTFRVSSRQGVDDVVARLVGAGHECRQEPVDAFWGARFAIVADPDGRDVGLMSPADEEHRGPPPNI